MSFRILPRKSLLISAVVTSVAVVPCLFASPAKAGSEPYIGWDFGNGFGIGIGTPPSAYDKCATYGWPIYPTPNGCRYSHSSYRRSQTTTTVHRDYAPPPPPSDADTVHRDYLEPPPPAPTQLP
jgi:hypothetical protein